MAKYLLYILGSLLVILPMAALAVMLYPGFGSQTWDSIELAHQISSWQLPLLILGLLLALGAAVGMVRSERTVWTWLVLLLPLALLAYTIYFSMGRSAPRIFQEAGELRFAEGATDAIPLESIVMGVASNGEAKAYPLRLLAYHHRVVDSIGGEDMWVTYCTMCRTGKVFRPEIGGRALDFELVGAIRFNSIYEDRQTGTWWYQANGKAAVGELEGERLTEVRADQMTLERWLELHPESRVLQPDPGTGKRYETYDMHQFDQQRSREQAPIGWQWVVGVTEDGKARGYPWSQLARDRLIRDEFGDRPLAIYLHDDELSPRVFDQRLGDRVLDLRFDADAGRLVDDGSGTSFGFDGRGTGGELDGIELASLPFVVEYWHSFERFSEAELWQAPAESQDAAGEAPGEDAATEEVESETASGPDSTNEDSAEESTEAPAENADAAVGDLAA